MFLTTTSKCDENMKQERMRLLNIWFHVLIVFVSHSLATAEQRLVIEASCLLHSTADSQT